MASTSVFRSRVLGGPFQLLRAASRSSLIALVISGAALVSGVLTYLTITGLAPYNPTPATMVVLIVVDLSLVLALAGLIVWRLTRLWTERRSGAAGSKLHLRLVAMFCAIAVMPAILVAIFAAVSLNLGVEAWFSERVQTALNNSVSVADAYVEEHKQVIRGDIQAMVVDLDRRRDLINNAEQFKELLASQAAIRALPAVYIIDSTGRVLASAVLPSVPTPFGITSDDVLVLANPRYPAEPSANAVTPEQIAQAAQGQLVLADSNQNVVSALAKLDAFNDARGGPTYLLVSRVVDPQVLEAQSRTHDAVSEYQRLSQNRSEI